MPTQVAVMESLKALMPGQELIVSLGKDGKYVVQVKDSSSLAGLGHKRSRVRVQDLETGTIYKSKSACGFALLDLVRDKVKLGQESWAFYTLQKVFPERFKEL